MWVPFQSWLMVCAPGKAKVSVHPAMGSPRLRMSAETPKPPCHWLVTVQVTWHPAAAWASVATSAPMTASPAAAPAAALRMADMASSIH